jgi:ATP-dependent Clp protease ATP-binding subunit ClpB
LSEAARDYLAAEGYDPQFGARPLKRVIQHEVENRIARAILDGSVHEGSVINIDSKDGKLVLFVTEPHAQEHVAGGTLQEA